MKAMTRRRKAKLRMRRKLETKFMDAMSVNDYDTGMELIDKKIDLSTALFFAMSYHREDFGKILLEKGADPSQGMWGSLHGYDKGHVPKAYIDYLLDADLFDVLGMKDVLNRAGHCKELIRILCEHGIDINADNYQMAEGALQQKLVRPFHQEATEALRYQLGNGLDAEGAFIHFIIKSHTEDLSLNQRKTYNKYALILFQEAKDFGLDISLWQYNARQASSAFEQEQKIAEKDKILREIYEKISKQINDVSLIKAGCNEVRGTVRAEFSRLARGDIHDFIVRYGPDLCAQAKDVDGFMDYLDKANINIFSL